MFLNTREKVAFSASGEKGTGSRNFQLQCVLAQAVYKDLCAQKGTSESETQWEFPALIVETGQVPSWLTWRMLTGPKVSSFGRVPGWELKPLSNESQDLTTSAHQTTSGWNESGLRHQLEGGLKFSSTEVALGGSVWLLASVSSCVRQGINTQFTILC